MFIRPFIISVAKKQDSRTASPLSCLHLFSKTKTMVTKFSHTTLFVNDQEKAYNFYVNILGFKVNTDATDGKWLSLAYTQCTRTT